LKAEPSVWVFFYGSFINPGVLRQYDVALQAIEVAKLGGYDIAIQPLATLIPSAQHCVYGIVASLTHIELRKLYSQDWVSGYDPYPVLVESERNKFMLALCYIAAKAAEPSAPSADYLMKIIVPAQEYGFPQWYVERLQSFRSPDDK
jgi:hypothetical protein